MKSKIIIGSLMMVMIGAIMLFWTKRPESTSADSNLIESRNNEIISSSVQTAPQNEVHQEDPRMESKITLRKESRFTAIDRLIRLKDSDMSIEKLGIIKKSLASGSVLSKPRKEGNPIETIDEAFDFMNTNVNMSYIPQKYFEDNNAFYFSGGITTDAVLDFSSGIAVNKEDRTITSWEFHR